MLNIHARSSPFFPSLGAIISAVLAVLRIVTNSEGAGATLPRILVELGGSACRRLHYEGLGCECKSKGTSLAAEADLGCELRG